MSNKKTRKVKIIRLNPQHGGGGEHDKSRAYS